jgi:hypothetical protein
MKTPRSLVNMSTKHIRIAELAKEDKGRKFFSIVHLLTENALYEAFKSLRKDASVGVDGVTYEGYAADVTGNIHRLHDRMKKGQYRAEPLRRKDSRNKLPSVLSSSRLEASQISDNGYYVNQGPRTLLTRGILV